MLGYQSCWPPGTPAMLERSRMLPLPIDVVLPELISALSGSGVRAVVLEAPPGAGKTTRVPWAVQQWLGDAEVVVSEPRRLAARMAARRVADERGEGLGERVGYSVRFEDVSSARTYSLRD